MAKKKRTEEHMDESWLLPYSDLMTLLLALFIVLAASSTTDTAKLEQMSEFFQSFIIGGPGIMDYTAPTAIDETPEIPIIPEDEFEAFMEKREAESLATEMENLENLKQTIDHFIESKGLGMSLVTKLSEHGLLITISDVALFESGSATVRSDAVPLAKEISSILSSDRPREIMVTGHTDDIPIFNDRFRSNWELSAIRAINFLEILLENKAHDPNNFSAIGYGEHRPMESNKTKKGRDKNRRVEVLILPSTTVSFHP